MPEDMLNLFLEEVAIELRYCGTRAKVKKRDDSSRIIVEKFFSVHVINGVLSISIQRVGNYGGYIVPQDFNLSRLNFKLLCKTEMTDEDFNPAHWIMHEIVWKCQKQWEIVDTEVEEDNPDKGLYPMYDWLILSCLNCGDCTKVPYLKGSVLTQNAIFETMHRTKCEHCESKNE